MRAQRSLRFPGPGREKRPKPVVTDDQRRVAAVPVLRDDLLRDHEHARLEIHRRLRPQAAKDTACLHTGNLARERP